MSYYIERGLALNVFTNYKDGDLVRAGMARAGLNAVPAADVRENVKGEWIPYEFGDETWHKCSNCGIADQYGFKYLSFNGTKNIIYSVRNFCPNCGADMRGESDDNQSNGNIY